MNIPAVTRPKMKVGMSAVTLSAHGLAGILAHGSSGADCHRRTGDNRNPIGVLDCLLALALEISDRSMRCHADRAAAHRIGLLCAANARTAEPAWPLVVLYDGAYFGIHV